MCDECEYEDTLDEISEMLDKSIYAFAERTLEGIMETIDRTGHMTDNQRTAVNNIRKSKERI